jgi:c-di-GMP-related signal transduction protein
MTSRLVLDETMSGAHPGMAKSISRRPIFDRRQAVFSYELLLHSGLAGFLRPQGPEAAHGMVVDAYLLQAMETLAGQRRVFLDFDREALVSDFASLLPRERIVVEIPKTLRPDADVIAACHRLKRSGYMIALTDPLSSGQSASLLSFADFVKVDFQRNAAPERTVIANCLASLGVRLLADNVECAEDMRQGLDAGYTFFQGSFYCKPQRRPRRDIPGFRPNYLRMLHAVSQADLDLGEIEQILKQEPSLLVKLLRYLNSAYFYFCQKVTSIRHALTLLGEDNIRKWTFVVAASDLASDTPDELIILSLIRARFCELTGLRLGLPNRETDLFLLGLLSAMDAAAGCEMRCLLDGLPVADDIKAALTGSAGPLRQLLELILAYEAGDWHQAQTVAAGLGVHTPYIPGLYLQSVDWTRRIYVD